MADGQPGGVGQVPVEVARARVDEAGVAAAHQLHDIGCAHDFVGLGLGELLGYIDADLGQGVDDGGVDLVGGRGPGGADVDLARGVVVEEGGLADLRPAQRGGR